MIREMLRELFREMLREISRKASERKAGGMQEKIQAKCRREKNGFQ